MYLAHGFFQRGVNAEKNLSEKLPEKFYSTYCNFLDGPFSCALTSYSFPHLTQVPRAWHRWTIPFSPCLTQGFGSSGKLAHQVVWCNCASFNFPTIIYQ